MNGLLRFTGAVKRDPAIKAWFASHPDELRSLGERWFARLLECGPDVRELLHDGLATACVDDAPFAYVGVFTSHVSVGFFHGSSLPAPEGLCSGSGRHMRHVKLKPGSDVDEQALEALITAAYTDIVKRTGLSSSRTI